MSSLFAGPSSITPWIEDTCFRALIHGPEPQRPRLVQVLALRLSTQDCDDCPSFLVVHDGKTSAITILSDNAIADTEKNGLPTKGCIVRISNWNVSLVEHCAGKHVPHLLAKPDAASYYLDFKPRLCFSVENVETLGAHGIGIVGNPVYVTESLQVRRALMSLETKKKCLSQQLKLVTPLGNVQELFREGRTDVIDALLANAKKQDKETPAFASTNTPNTTTTTTTTNSSVVLGNVRALFEASRNQPPEDNLVSQIFAMANSQSNERTTTTTFKPTASSTPTNNEASTPKNQKRKEYSSQALTAPSNSNGRVVLGDVKALLEGRLDLGVPNPVDAIFAAASNTDASAVSTRKPKRGDNSANVTRMPQSTEQEACEDLSTQRPVGHTDAELAQVVEPYDIGERVDSRASAVSIYGIGSVLKSVFGRKSSISESAADVEDEQTSGAVRNVSTRNATQEESQSQQDEDSESEVAGISDMLISQTQEGSVKMVVGEEVTAETSEVVASKKRSREQAQEEADGEKGNEAAVSNLDDTSKTQSHDDYDALDDEENCFAEENAARPQLKPQGKRAKTSQGPKRKREGMGMLKMWKELRARRKERLEIEMK